MLVDDGPSGTVKAGSALYLHQIRKYEAEQSSQIRSPPSGGTLCCCGVAIARHRRAGQLWSDLRTKLTDSAPAVLSSSAIKQESRVGRKNLEIVTLLSDPAVTAPYPDRSAAILRTPMLALRHISNGFGRSAVVAIHVPSGIPVSNHFARGIVRSADEV